jgi:hypothetical protein
VFDAVFTAAELAPAALEGALAGVEALLAGVVELEVELLPHAANVSDMASVGMRVFRVGRIETPLAGLPSVAPARRLWGRAIS